MMRAGRAVRVPLPTQSTTEAEVASCPVTVTETVAEAVAVAVAVAGVAGGELLRTGRTMIDRQS
jgi:hypothetical protein